jgi:predicted nucleotidyltransferase
VYLSSKESKDIVSLLKTLIPSLEAVYLFGSYGDGVASENSDVDIGYLSGEEYSQLERWEMSQKLASALGKDVDLVDMRQTNTIFRYQILSTGKRIYGSGYDVESFENLAYSFYLRFQEERKPIVDAIMRDKRVLHGS